MSSLLERSYEYCRNVAKTEARNFYYSFTVLPPPQKMAMCAVYAFFRYCDDISDEAALSEGKQGLLCEWRAALDRALQGDYGSSLILPAFHDTVQRYKIPARFFYELIDGAEMDFTDTRYESFEDLRRYCYRVASTVGFVCIHIWGFEGGEAAFPAAEACGLAFQLTNILRDVKEDAERGRIYLPMEDLRRFGVTEEQLIEGRLDANYSALMQFETERARGLYDQARELIPRLSAEGRTTYLIMYRIYRGLLDQIEAQGYDVYSRRARLSSMRKIGIVARTWLDARLSRSEVHA